MKRIVARLHPARPLGVVTLLAVLAVAATWPIASDPAHLSLAGPFNNDFHFNTWVVFWGAHALTSQPLALHHANIFWPEPYTFAYSDIELSHSALLLPAILAGAGPTLTMNLLILLAMVIGGLGAHRLALHLTASPLAAWVGALVFVFNDAHFARHRQVQYFGDHWLPWMALALLLWLETRSRRWALAAGALFVAHALTGSHNAVFAALVAAVVILVHLLRSGDWRRRELWTGAALFALLPVLMLPPIFYPYLLVEDRLADVRGDSREHLLDGSATARDLLSGTSRLHVAMDERLGWPSAWIDSPLRRHLFPGWIPLLLGLLALLGRRRDASPGGTGMAAARTSAAPWLVLAAICLLLALGPRLGLYDLLAGLPGLRLIRVPSRFVLPGLLALAMLAALGAVRLRPHLGVRRWRQVIGVALLLFAIESVAAPLPTARVDPGPDPVAAWLAAQPGDFAVLELPVEVDNLTIHVRQMQQSLYHWKKLLVGYSGWRSPEVRRRLLRIHRRFPGSGVLDDLAALRVRFIVVLERRVESERFARMRSEPRLRQVERFEDISIWELDPDRWIGDSR